MKKITLIILLLCGMYTLSMAQTASQAATTSTSKQDKAAIAAQKKADKEAKEAAKKQAKEAKVAPTASATNTAHLNKNGTPDKRFKANKQPNPATKAQAPTPAAAPTPASTKVTTSKTSTPSVAHTSAPKSADKEIGKDSKGRTLYMGPRGGKYYLTANGNKEYVK